MSNHDEACEVRQRLAELRCSLDEDVTQVSKSAHAMADWHYYPRRFPWMTFALAATAGYLLVPKRTEIISPDAETLAKLAKSDQLVVTRKPKAEATSDGLANYLIAMVSASVLRAGMAYLKNNINSLQSSRQQASHTAGD